MQSTHSIKDRLDADYAPAWKPKPDETVTGEVVALDSRIGWDDQPYPILTIRTDDGEVAVHAFHTVLRNELAAKRPAVNEVVGIRYLGKRGKDRQYHSYRVEVERPDAQLDWSAFAEAEPPEHSTDVHRPLGTDGKGGDDVPF